jgi:hypothetical protein
MISQWAADVIAGTVSVIPADDLLKSGLTGGEKAAIIVGCIYAAVVISILAAILIKWTITSLNIAPHIQDGVRMMTMML